MQKEFKGTGDQFYIDKTLLQVVKQRKKNLGMRWINDRKANDTSSSTPG